MVVQNAWTPTVRRGPIAAEFKGPGPASFEIKSTIGSDSPRYTFRQKHAAKVDRIKPGPGSYQIEKITRKGPDRVIAPTISVKLKDPEKFNTPSPGAYEPNKSDNSTHESSPSYTFGNKPDLHKPNQNPSPAHYDPVNSTDAILEVAPSYTFGSKPNDEKPNQNPSPNHYSLPDVLTTTYVSGKVNSPSYTIRSKTAGWVDRTKKPGPGAHSPEKVNLKREKPAYTFGCKHSPYTANLKDLRR